MPVELHVDDDRTFTGAQHDLLRPGQHLDPSVTRLDERHPADLFPVAPMPKKGCFSSKRMFFAPFIAR